MDLILVKNKKKITHNGKKSEKEKEEQRNWWGKENLNPFP